MHYKCNVYTRARRRLPALRVHAYYRIVYMYTHTHTYICIHTYIREIIFGEQKHLSCRRSSVYTVPPSVDINYNKNLLEKKRKKTGKKKTGGFCTRARARVVHRCYGLSSPTAVAFPVRPGRRVRLARDGR